MVSVPVTTGSAREIQPLGGARLRYARSDNLVGKAVEQFGRQMAETADVWDKIEAHHDEADALRIENEYSTYERERLRTGENAYLRTQGFNASDSREPTVEDLRTGANNLLESARSQRARGMAQRALQAKFGASQSVIAEHSMKQLDVALDQQSQARLDMLATDAIDQRGTEQFLVALGTGGLQLADMAERKGWGQDQLQAEQMKWRSNVLSRAVLAYDAEDGEPTRALQFLEDNAGAILPEDQAKLEASLAPRVDAAAARRIVDGGGLDAYLAPGTAPVPVAGAEAAQPEGAAPPDAPVSLAIPFSGTGTTVPGGRWGAHRSYGGHTGIDMAGLAPGTPVPPAGQGTVVFAGRRNGYGNRVEIDHGLDSQGRRIVTSYSHLGEIDVQQGQVVGEGAVVGGVGSSGGNYGTHLHFEVMVDGVKVDPSTVAGMNVRPASAAPSPEATYDSATMRQAVDRYIAAERSAGRPVSERMQEALYDEAERSVNRRRADRAQAEAEADRRLMDWLTENRADPDSLVSEADIPAALLQGASPSTRAAINSRIQATRSRLQSERDAAAAKAAKDQEQAAVFELYALTDAELARTDLRQYAGRVGLDKMGPWIDRQQRLQDPNGANRPVAADRIAGKIDSIGKAYGANRGPDATDEQRELWIATREYVERRVGGMPNKEVNDEQLRGIIGQALQEVEKPGTGWFGSNVGNETARRAELPTGTRYRVDIPPDIRRDIISNLRQRLGRAPNNEEVIEAYSSGRMRGIF